MTETSRLRRLAAAASLGGVLLAAGGCRQGMYNQPRGKTLAESDFFRDGLTSRVPPANTVARGFLREDRAFFQGIGPDGKFVAELPVPLTKPLLERGHQRFDVFCSPCHARQGNGNGMIVQRGFKQAANFHEPRLRQQPVGYFFDVMSNGFGQMSSYASQIPVEDRWAIAAYVRSLQLSQHVVLADLPAETRERLRAEVEKGVAAASHPKAGEPAPHEGKH